MAHVKAGSTDPVLLHRVAALWDDPAWREFHGRYDPFVRDRCSHYGLDPESRDELCQRVWVELARRMPSYQYDPGGSFRGWLRRLCHHRAIDLLRERKDSPVVAIGEDDRIDPRREASDNTATAETLALLREAQEVQGEVRRKVKPVRWEVFRRVVIEGQSMSETAAALGMKYATVYAAVNHVARLLREEGRRRAGGLGPDPGPFGSPNQGQKPSS